jgi:anti-anti-sigma regulatory factor
MEDAISAAEGSERRIVFADNSFAVSRTATPPGLMFAGEIDITNSSLIAEALRGALVHGYDPHLDFSRVSFGDISGIMALVNCAREMGPGRRLLLHGLPGQLEAVLKVTGWADLPGLELCDCRLEC